MRRNRKLLLAAVATGGVAVPLAIAGVAFGHGYTDSPESRQAKCASGEVADCGAVAHEPQSVEGPKGFPDNDIADGSICSAGLEGFAALDDPRGGEWPTTTMNPGEQTFHWTLTAPHATDKWEFFITKDGWDGTKALTRADLEAEPFFTQDDGGAKPGNSVDLTVNVPDKTGRHLILGVWTIADTSNAFYACSDVTFE
ncbi:lytic polysaccharide monooxygenase auxiliary activity family 9 protein [Stackebrandtia nassauensis]|uniref:Chitin-binding domain 3 protein n=1 Tax=Stackebrandtia nassauensis (strain DSM 44728 / CIP 108903 / NRRL B-16338 / NBRC 102104 / LLR-40K-21) TaxID=446470 RepID=D3QBH2_STANL|nr:lytic polysaccharide monooxygenase auxiliary activity family 9 protein [Stackebrandtia nassauensis]ADD42854.1 chitin-binding domain 3 protein [Stackebrandtia nassauensis DSM 44728]